MSKTIWRRGPWKVEKISHQQQGILALVSIEKKNMVISLIYSFTCLNLHISFIPKICIVKWNSHDMYCISKGLFYVLQDLLWLAKKITSQASIIEISVGPLFFFYSFFILVLQFANSFFFPGQIFLSIIIHLGVWTLGKQSIKDGEWDLISRSQNYVISYTASENFKVKMALLLLW